MNTRLVFKHTFFALALGAIFTTAPAFAQTSDSATVNNRLASLAKSLVNARKELKQGFAQLQARQSTITTTEPAIGNNTPNNTYQAIDFYDGRTASTVMQHNAEGITLALRVLEGGKKVEEKVLKFNFQGRSADQKEADTLVLKTCLDMFLRAADKQSSFFIQINQDPTLGIMCATN